MHTLTVTKLIMLGWIQKPDCVQSIYDLAAPFTSPSQKGNLYLSALLNGRWHGSTRSISINIQQQSENALYQPFVESPIGDSDKVMQFSVVCHCHSSMFLTPFSSSHPSFKLTHLHVWSRSISLLSFRISSLSKQAHQEPTASSPQWLQQVAVARHASVLWTHKDN